MTSLTRTLGALVLTAAAGFSLAACSTDASGAPAPSTSASSPAKPTKGKAKPLPAGESRVAGTVSTVSATQLVVTKKDGSTETLTTDSTTKIEGGPVQQGQRVTAIVKGEQALSVRVAQPHPSSGAPTSSAAPTTTPSS
ncbi:hypothetical protein [Kutzneria buriramensis]|uniref:DUF5666 domain-containing protein n=1 Tax=Kutzneria buriramensis TaxID=1045776 RepID=A0A3E0HCE5_9PSEU|nr:hypothetical protein [Kutzneria buriramensis]REH42054.1 hypothetical protein BCF44_111359 [Kutzneria buriramensis]